MRRFILHILFLFFMVPFSNGQAVVAVNDTFYAVEDSVVTVNVQMNDYGGPAVCAGVFSTDIWATPHHGTAFVVFGKNIVYTPDANYFGNDTLQYQLCDCIVGSNNCSIAQVIFNVDNRNDSPIANFDLDTLKEDNVKIINVQKNDIEPDGDFLVTINGGQAPQHGIAIILNNDSIRYIPNANYFGPDSFIYKVCDNPIGPLGLCDTAWVFIYVTPVNDKPVAIDDLNKSTNEDTPFTVDVQANDSDVDNDFLTTAFLSGPQHGSVIVLNGDSVRYSPTLNFNGFDTIIYKICDNGNPMLCDTAILAIRVLAVNDKPIATDDLINTTTEDVPLTITVQSNDIDVDNNPLITTILANPPHGGVQVTGNKNVLYTPQSNFFGVDTFYYKVCDNGSPALCDSAMVVVNVSYVNDKPVANDDVLSTQEEIPVTIYPLTNDLDVENGVLNITVVTTSTNGMATLVGDSIAYAPNLNFYGIDTIRIKVCDDGVPSLCDTSLIIINVLPVNDKPIATDDYVTVSEAKPAVIDVQYNDIDVDNFVLNTRVISNPQNGTVSVLNNDSILYTGNTGYFGPDTFQYVICDNAVPSLCDTAVVYVTVNQVNDKPVANDDNVVTVENTIPIIINVQLNDFDVDNTHLMTTIIRIPTHGNVSVLNGDSLSYQPNAHFSGNDTIIYVICDDGVPVLCDTAMVFITVNNINDKPFAIDDVFNFMVEDSSIIIDVQQNDYDIDNITLATTIIVAPHHGQATVVNDDSITYIPNANYNGPDTIIYRLCDNGIPPLCDTAIVVVNVSPINDAPVANNDTVLVNSGFPITIPVLENDFDVDGESLGGANVVLPKHGTVSINADSTLQYIPDANYEGYDTIKYYICDALGICDSALVIIYVNKNVAPLAVDDEVTYFETQTMTIPVLDNDSDADGDLLNIVLANPFHGMVSVSNGVVTYIPNIDFIGTDSFQYAICDNGSPVKCDTAWVVVHVLEGDIKPLIDNSISPNGDGKNDALVIYNLSLFSNTQMKMMNRWGDIVYSRGDYQNDFDGNGNTNWKDFNDRVLPEGTYFYVFTYTYNSLSKTVSGYVLIKR